MEINGSAFAQEIVETSLRSAIYLIQRTQDGFDLGRCQQLDEIEFNLLSFFINFTDMKVKLVDRLYMEKKEKISRKIINEKNINFTYLKRNIPTFTQVNANNQLVVVKNNYKIYHDELIEDFKVLDKNLLNFIACNAIIFGEYNSELAVKLIYLYRCHNI
jgi:hypothetical protein